MTAISAVSLILVVPNRCRLQRHDPVAPKVRFRNMSYDGPQLPALLGAQRPAYRQVLDNPLPGFADNADFQQIDVDVR
jgi:hypothetical protein